MRNERYKHLIVPMLPNENDQVPDIRCFLLKERNANRVPREIIPCY